jgi:hypothetical protein
VRAKAWALSEELFAESKKIILGEEKTLGEEFFTESIFTTLSEDIF